MSTGTNTQRSAYNDAMTVSKLNKAPKTPFYTFSELRWLLINK